MYSRAYPRIDELDGLDAERLRIEMLRKQAPELLCAVGEQHHGQRASPATDRQHVLLMLTMSIALKPIRRTTRLRQTSQHRTDLRAA